MAGLFGQGEDRPREEDREGNGELYLQGHYELCSRYMNYNIETAMSYKDGSQNLM